MCSEIHLNFLKRRNRLIQRSIEKKIDGFLTFDFPDLFYLTGFPSEGVFVLVSKAGDYLFSNSLILEQLKSYLQKNEQEIEIVSEKKLIDALKKVIKKNGLKKIGFDPAKVSYALYKQFSAFKGTEWAPLENFLFDQRMIKDEIEIKLISDACRTASECVETCLEQLKEGQSEKETEYFIENYFRRKDSKTAFETIAAFGDHTAFPHHTATHRKLIRQSVVTIDLGCKMNGYRSDLTRTIFYGRMTPQFKKIFKIVEKAQQEGICMVREGVSVGQVDAVCRNIIRKAGYGSCFVHSTGHGIGIETHEPPRLTGKSKEVLKEGMVVTVEPGIYLPGQFGVRIEDTVLVKKNGCEILTMKGRKKNDRNI